MSKKSNKLRYKGLKFSYRVGGKVLMDKYQTINDFLSTDFPKNNNPLSPIDETILFNIKWNNNPILSCSGEHKLSEIKNILKNFDPNQLKRKKVYSIKENTNQLERKETYSIEDVEEKVKNVLFEKERNLSKVNFDGDMIKGNSQRYQTFFTKGCKCAKCGIKGEYFAKEKHLKDRNFHLNLYAIDENGKEILMAKDHIIPKSKGGANDISNYQTMCERCNEAKGNRLED